jgi:hypothetical protein
MQHRQTSGDAADPTGRLLAPDTSGMNFYRATRR